MSNEQSARWTVTSVQRGDGSAQVTLGTSLISHKEAAWLTAARESLTPVCVRDIQGAITPNERDAFEAIGHRKGMEDAFAVVTGCAVDDAKFKAQSADLRARLVKIRAEGFAAGLTRARDLLAAHADESEATARGQATEAEQAQTRAAASATRAAVQRGGVALLDREIAALKGEGK